LFKNIKSLKSKIFFGYLLIIFILFIVTMWSIINFTNLSDSITNIMVENYNSIKACESMIESIERQDSAILIILNGQINKGKNTFLKNEKDFYKWLSRAEDNITIEGEDAVIKKIDNNYLKFLNHFDTFQNLETTSNKRKYYNSNIFSLFHEIKNKIRELRKLNQNQMLKAQKKANLRADHATVSTIIISIVAIVIALFFSFYLSKQILKPIEKLKKAVTEVSNKNFQYKITMRTSNEIGELTKQFNNMIERLQEYEKINVEKLVDEKNKSEAIVNNINNPLMVLDNDNQVILLNHNAKKLFNIINYEKNKHFLELINYEDLFSKIQKSKEKKNMSNNSVKLEINNKEKHFKVNTNNILNESNEVKYLVVTLEDITKLKKIDNMKSEFVSTVSHEFRTPLTSMNMGLELILKEEVGEINDEQKELIEAALEDTERLKELVDDLLDLSKIESGKIKMNFDKFNVKNLIEKTTNPFEKQLKEKDLDLKIDEINDNIYAYADPSKISWVISNLIGNALRYTDSGYIKISAEKKGYRIYFYVEDTGKGIPEEYQDKIFDKFVRADNTEEVKGTGLGLAIVKEIVSAHNGKIWVDSKEGERSKFIFHIPSFKKDNNKEI